MNTTIEAPAAFATCFTPDEVSALEGVAIAKGVIADAEQNNALVRSLMSFCRSNSLIEIDCMRVICANLINQHGQATVAMTNMYNEIQSMREHMNREAVKTVPAGRKLVETWRSGNDELLCRCDDGTVWRLETKRTPGNIPRVAD